jgi:SWI/SNF-related matrix-associated actin-dependent regulator of chromatin subfamily A containing DEAD/H box 1
MRLTIVSFSFFLLVLIFIQFEQQQTTQRSRIGQKRPVTVIKLVTQDTVDNDIFEMQERKAKMNAAIMENNNSNNNNNKNESSKWNDKQVQQHVLRTAVDRYLKSPPSAATAVASSQKMGGRGNSSNIDISTSTDLDGGLCN